MAYSKTVCSTGINKEMKKFKCHITNKVEHDDNSVNVNVCVTLYDTVKLVAL